MDQRSVIEKAAKDLAFLQEYVLGVLLYGSWFTGKSHEKSDIDICIVAPFAEDKTALWRSAIAAVRDDRYDIRIRADAPSPEDEGDRTGSCCLFQGCIGAL